MRGNCFLEAVGCMEPKAQCTSPSRWLVDTSSSVAARGWCIAIRCMHPYDFAASWQTTLAFRAPVAYISDIGQHPRPILAYIPPRLPACLDQREITMLNLLGRSQRYCDGVHRRTFLKIGGLAMGGVSLPGLLQAEQA